MAKKFDCWTCRFKEKIPGDCHISCSHPKKNTLNIKADEWGVRNGWFAFPFNFDPTWLKNCDGYENP